jgi:hypothetical protein
MKLVDFVLGCDFLMEMDSNLKFFDFFANLKKKF